MWKRLNDFLSLLLTLLTLLFLLDNFVFLTLHPVNVIDLVGLHLVVESTFPVGLTLGIFDLIDGLHLGFNFLDFLLNGVHLSSGLVFLSIGLLEFFPNLLHCFVEDVFLATNHLDLSPNLALLSLKSLGLWVNLLIAFHLG